MCFKKIIVSNSLQWFGHTFPTANTRQKRILIRSRLVKTNIINFYTTSIFTQHTHSKIHNVCIIQKSWILKPVGNNTWLDNKLQTDIHTRVIDIHREFKSKLHNRFFIVFSIGQFFILSINISFKKPLLKFIHIIIIVCI